MPWSALVFIEYSSKSLTDKCQAAISEVGTEAILECMGVATDLCGTPDASEAKANAEAAANSGAASQKVRCLFSRRLFDRCQNL